MYLLLNVLVLIIVTIADSPAKIGDAWQVTNAPAYIVSYLSSNLDALEKVGISAYLAAGNASPDEKFQQAGKAILNEIKPLKPFVAAGHWKITVEIPPDPKPRPSSSKYRVITSFRAGYKGVIKEAARLYFECTAKTLEECVPANAPGK